MDTRPFMAFLCCILIGAAASGAPARKAKEAAPEAGAFRDALVKLQSPNPTEVLNGVMVLGGSKSPKAVEPLITLLKNGPRDDITNAVIDALGALGDPTSLDILISYLNHRRSDIRQRVILAISEMKDQRIDAALENALRDSDAGVRNNAARAIGNRGQKQSIPILFKAFERGVTDAAVAIGQMGDADSARRLATFLGPRNLMDVLPGFDEFLRRNDFPEQGKLEILDHLLELAGPEVKRFLITFVAAFGEEDKRNKVKLKAEEIIRAIPDEE